MPRILPGLNGAALFFSPVRLAGHSTHRLFDWEFWFAAGYLAPAVINSVVLAVSYAATRPAPTRVLGIAARPAE